VATPECNGAWAKLTQEMPMVKEGRPRESRARRAGSDDKCSAVFGDRDKVGIGMKVLKTVPVRAGDRSTGGRLEHALPSQPTPDEA
jgi:hypothetical protein